MREKLLSSSSCIAVFLVLPCASCEMRAQPPAPPDGMVVAQAAPTPPPPPPADQPAPPLPADQAAPPPVPAQEQPEVLTSGPVHEAFAEPVPLQAEAPVTAPQQPPPPVQETPPAEQPQGQNVTWVPGYWAWSPTRNNFLWVSGCWRVAPPNLSWVPGYWAQSANGWEWVAGFWTPAGSQEIEYLPAPPALPDVAAPGPAPSPDNMWVPPCWYWRDGRYVLRAGYWLTPQAGWMWVPSHFIWTPRGYVFAEGHWDYSLSDRGVLFAPVYFSRPAFALSFTPGIVVNIGDFSASLFVYPRYCHYYFGDYYDTAYLNMGIYPEFEARRLHTWYDPIYRYDRWRFGHNEAGWEERQVREYETRRADPRLRPPRTYREMETRLARLPEAQRRSAEVARPLAAAVASRSTPLRFEHVNPAAQQQLARQATEARQYREQRSRWEAAKPAQPARPVEPRTGEAAAPRTAVQPPRPAASPERITPAAPARSAAPAVEHTPVPPRPVYVTQPERVRVPAPPAVGRSIERAPAERAAPEAAPPPRPSSERQSTENRGERQPTEGRGERPR